MTELYFEDIPIRCICKNKEWWFLIEDFIKGLTGSPKPMSYWSMLKKYIKYCNQENMLTSKWSALQLREFKVKNKSMDFTNKDGLFILFKNSPNDKIELMNKWLNSLDLSALEK